MAEVTAAFHEYERALMADDVPAMDRLFHASPATVRYGVGEVLYGIDAIREFRRAAADRRNARWGASRSRPTAATSPPPTPNSTAKDRIGAGARARPGCAFADGWKVVSAHVSIEGATP